jgi:enamine deaminase RidA (YjgF/YER057c/UK114 family)
MFMDKGISYINPEGLSRNPAFTQVVTRQGNGKTIYIGGQDALNKQGEIIGKENIAEQTEQVMKNLETALSACGACFRHLVKLSIYIVQGQDVYGGIMVSQKNLGHLDQARAISVLVVAGLAHPDFLLEIDATAFIPED